MTYKEAVEEVVRLFPNVRKIPIQNVGMWGNDKVENALNLALDKKLYRWDGDQYTAIRMVLKLQNKI